MAKESEVLLQPGHKWNNIVFHNHTGLKQYPNYMMGGGYLVSGDVAQTLMNVNRKMRLKFTPIEDATMGFWLAAMVCTYLNCPKFGVYMLIACAKSELRLKRGTYQNSVSKRCSRNHIHSIEKICLCIHIVRDIFYNCSPQNACLSTSEL